MHRDQEYGRGERDEIRRGERMDAAPPERYGNEEDAYSRDYRRAYPEQQLERRLHDDAPYSQPGYEPEMGRPGARQNVDLDRRRGPERGGRGYDGGGRTGYGDRAATHDRGLPGQPSQRHAFETSGEDWTDHPGPDRGREMRQPGQRVWQSGYSSGRQVSPYDQGDVSSWYGGDTGMGDSGSSLDRPGYGQPGYSQPGYGQPGYGQPSYSRPSHGPYGNPFNVGQISGAQVGGGRDGRQEQGGPFGGPFRGRGPRGYQRSDERIREDVCELLTAHGQIDASSMEVEVQHGTVTLRGMADSGRVRRLTEEAVEEIPGVRDVENQLRVNQRTGHSEELAGTGRQQGSEQHESQWQGQGTQHQGGQRMSGGMGAAQTNPAQTTPAYGFGVAETSGVSTRSGPGEPGMSAGAGPSQHGNRWQIRETMDVVGSDGESIGTVKTVRGTDFLVSRPHERDLYAPFSAVQTVDSERVMLSCQASEVERQNWPAASLTGGA